MNQLPTPTRRSFLAASGAALAGVTGASAATPFRRPRVAAVYTVCTHRSHANVILENFLESYPFNGKQTDPGVDLVSLYSDQQPAGDMTPSIVKGYGIPHYDTIREALCCGGDKLAVDAVLSIGEHGSYPRNELGQVQYPRKRFWDAIVAVMKDSDRFVPVFNDKHLSFDWDEAKAMYQQSQELGIPLLAGSSVPLAQRRPELELPVGSEFSEAVSIHGGPVESYDFHGLEVLQSIVEARRGHETGLASVEFLSGADVWKAADEGRWSEELAQSAIAREYGRAIDIRKALPGEGVVEPHCLLLNYRDGLQATVLKLGASSKRWNVACRLKRSAKIHSTAYYVGPWNNRNLFKALSHAIQQTFIQQKAVYPSERTLFVTGVLEASMRSRKAKQVIETPHLDLSYAARDFSAMREMGASWKIVTEDVPEPQTEFSPWGTAKVPE